MRSAPQHLQLLHMPDAIPPQVLVLENPQEGGAIGTKPVNRLFFLDNLRWTIIILVVSMHAADTYSPLGNWYFVDRKPLSIGSLLFFAAWQTYLQAFFMGLLFFVAGYFVPGSFDRKGPRRFSLDRAFRLGLPVLFYMFVLGPVTEYFIAHSWRSTQQTSFVGEWLKHIRNGQFLQENGPLWFCLALLIFCLGYTILRMMSSSRTAVVKTVSVPGTAALISFGIVMACSTFMVRINRPASIFNLPLRDFSQYVLLFAAGIVASRQNWLPQLSYRSGMRWMTLALSFGFVFWLALLIAGGALRNQASTFSGGWHWQSAAFAFWESFTCLGLCYGLLVLFREKCDTQGSIARFFSDNAFSVYVFHAPVVVVGALLLHAFPGQPILKFLMLTVISVLASFLLSAALFRRIPLLRRIL